MREGWYYKKLGDIGTFLRGNGILKSDFVEKGSPCIHYGQIHTKFGISVDSHLTEISESLFSKSKIANYGDIIIAITSEDIEGSCKCIAWLGKYDVAVGAHAAIFKHSQNSKYLSYCFRSKDFAIQKAKYAHGFKVVEIKPSEIAEIFIPVPPLSIQDQIVSELDIISQILDFKRQQLKEYDILSDSIFFDMFGDPILNSKGWELKKLKEISTKITDGSHNPPKGTLASEYKMISSQNVFNRKLIIDNNNVRYLSKEDFETENKRTNVKEGDILLTIVGTIGRSYVVKKHEKFVLQRSVAVISPNELVNSEYLSSYFIAINGELDSYAHGIAQKGIYLKQLADMKVPLPPIGIQQKFAKIINTIEQQKLLLQESIDEIEILFQSRMDYWFNS